MSSTAANNGGSGTRRGARTRFRLSYSIFDTANNDNNRQQPTTSSPTLKGRAREIATLKKLYHDAAHASKVLIVEGKAGVGKTALINSQFSCAAGSYVRGQFDPQRQHEPFSAIVDALHDLLEEVLQMDATCHNNNNSTLVTIMKQFQVESKNDAGIRSVLQNALPKFTQLIQAYRVRQQQLTTNNKMDGSSKNGRQMRRVQRSRNVLNAAAMNASFNNSFTSTTSTATTTNKSTKTSAISPTPTTKLKIGTPKKKKPISQQPPPRSASGYKKGWNFEKLKIALRLLLRCLCAPTRRVVILLDDLHHADTASLELIEFLASGDGLSYMGDTSSNKNNGSDDENNNTDNNIDDNRVQGLLLILAYRNSAPSAATIQDDSKNNDNTNSTSSACISMDHPFRQRLKEFKQLKCPIHRLHVKDFDLTATNDMVATVLQYSAPNKDICLPLSQVIFKKTGGNPFSILQLLAFLEHEQLLYFDTSSYTWQWKPVRTIHSATDLSDNLVDLVVKKLKALPPATQQILALGSCLGSYFRLEVVAAYFLKYNDVHHKIDFAKAAHDAAAEDEDEEWHPRQRTLNNLKTLHSQQQQQQPMNDLSHSDNSISTSQRRKRITSTDGSGSMLDQLQELLSLPLRQDLLTKRRKSTTYFFAHERLQTAAYSLLPSSKKEIHWRLGLLMKEKSQTFPEEHWMAYLATDQLNRGLTASKLQDTREKVELAMMNLQIALMSQEKSAFYPAAEFLRSAIALLFDEKLSKQSAKRKLHPSKVVEDPHPKQHQPSTTISKHAKQVWKEHYDLCLDLYSSLAEMEYLLGNHAASKLAVDQVLLNAKEEEDKFRAQVILIESISAQQDFDAAIDTCLNILSTAYDIKLSANPMKLQIMTEKKKVNKMLEQQLLQDQDAISLSESSTFSSLMNGSMNVSSPFGSTVSSPFSSVTSSLTKPVFPSGSVVRAKSTGPSLPKTESRFPTIPKNEGRFRRANTTESASVAKALHKKQEKAMMTLPEMTDPKAIRTSKLLSQLMLNAMFGGKTDLSAYVGLRSIRFSFQHGISPHSPMALAAYGISQAKEGKYNEAYANGTLALKLLDIVDSKEWYTRTILKCHNLRHIKKPFHESLDPLMAGYRTGVESGDMEYALLAAMQYSLLYLFVGLPLMPLEPDLMAFAEQVHRYHLPFVLEVTFYVYREFVLDMQGEEHDKISLDDNDDTHRSDGSGGSIKSSDATNEALMDKRVKPLIRREMCVMNLQKLYFFGEFVEAEKVAQELNDLPKFDYSVLRTIYRDTFIGLVNLALAKKTGKKAYRVKGRKVIEEFETYVKKGSVNSHHILLLLQAEDLAINNTDWNSVSRAYDEAIKAAARSGFTNHEALANERAGRYLSELAASDKNVQTSNIAGDQAKQYISRAMALYREWGAKAKAEQLAKDFPMLQPSTLMKGTNIKARRRFSRTLTARFRDMKLHSGRWSVGASSDLKILDGFDELRESETVSTKRDSLSLEDIAEGT